MATLLTIKFVIFVSIEVFVIGVLVAVVMGIVIDALRR